MKKTLISVLKLVIAFGLGIFIIYLSLKNITPKEKNDILTSLYLANYGWVLLSLVFGIFSHLIRAERWRMLLAPMGYKPGLRTTFYAVMIGYFANLGIPRSGEVARCTVLYKQNKIPVDKSVGTVIIERSIDLLIFVGLFFFAFLVEFNRINEYVKSNIFPALEEKFGFIHADLVFTFTILGVILMFFVTTFFLRKRILKIAFIQKITNLFSGIWEGLKSVVNIKRPGLFIMYSLLIWVNYYLMIVVGLQAIPETSNLGLGAALSVLVLGSIGIMLTPGGIGLYPVIVAQTLVLYGLSPNDGFGDAIGWLTWSSQTIMIIVIGSFSLIMISLKSKKNILPKV